MRSDTMAYNRFPALALAAAFLFTATSGCFAGDADPASTDATSSSGGPGSNSTAPATNTTEPAPMEPPVANFTVSANSTDANLTAGTDLIFNASSSVDPAGGNLTFTWSFGDNATGEGVVVNHTYPSEGNFTVELNVTSDASMLSDNLTAVLTIVAGKAKEVKFTDSSGDGTHNYFDIRIVTLTQDPENFVLKFTTGAVQPSGNQLLLTCWEIFLGTARFEVDSLEGEYGVYHSGNDYVDGATVKVVGTGYEVTIPLAYLEEKKLGPPFQFRMESRPSVCYVGAGNSPALDKAPDTGTVAYG